MDSRKELLQKINWDYTYTVDDFEKMLASPNLSDKKFIYVKLLQGARWYTLRKVLSDRELAEALSPEVIQAVFPRSLRDKYIYARSVLFGETLPAAKSGIGSSRQVGE